jgi:hypothetical protein
MEMATLLAIGELIAKYGVPAALSIVSVWKTDNEPTQEDIDRLKQMVPKPGTYFEG